ncbi:MAG: hypothetical protein ABUS57_00375 [Pseudomonadota bacterium]
MVDVGGDGFRSGRVAVIDQGLDIIGTPTESTLLSVNCSTSCRPKGATVIEAMIFSV